MKQSPSLSDDSVHGTCRGGRATERDAGAVRHAVEPSSAGAGAGATETARQNGTLAPRRRARGGSAAAAATWRVRMPCFLVLRTCSSLAMYASGSTCLKPDATPPLPRKRHREAAGGRRRGRVGARRQQWFTEGALVVESGSEDDGSATRSKCGGVVTRDDVSRPQDLRPRDETFDDSLSREVR